jgi:glycosyltransferase involved in cell wall biosynthesis
MCIARLRSVKIVNEALISIVIAAYNHGKYLPETIESVLAQTYKNIEVIVVDDGSTDNTREIVKQYPVKYLYQENRGASNAMNVGVRMSHGEFYITLGADDRLHPKYVETCLKEIMKDDKTAFIWTGAQEFGVSTAVRTPLPLLNRFSIYRGTGGQLGSALFRRKAYEDVGGYDETLPVYEDWDLAIRMVRCGWKGRSVSEPIYFWRRHKVSRNIKADPAVLRRFLEKKYPRMILYIQLARILDFLAILLSDQKESVHRLSKKISRKHV